MKTTMNVRNIELAAREDLKRAAQARGWTLADYIEKLLELHQRAMARPLPDVAELLSDLDLSEVSL